MPVHLPIAAIIPLFNRNAMGGCLLYAVSLRFDVGLRGMI
jgi:hypothetical protein